MGCGCQLLSVIKGGPIRKSPPDEKMKQRNGYEFKSRHCTLSWKEVCKKCALIEHQIEAGQKCLFLSYFDDDSESKLKGQFIVDNIEPERVGGVHINPKKYEKERFLLKWDISTLYNRIFYTSHQDEKDLQAWINAINRKDFFRKHFEIEEDEGVSVEEDDHHVDENVTRYEPDFRLSHELTMFKEHRMSYPNGSQSPLEDLSFTFLPTSESEERKRDSMVSHASSRTSGYFSTSGSTSSFSYSGHRGSNRESDYMKRLQELDITDKQE